MLLDWPVLKRPKTLGAVGPAGGDGGVLIDPLRQPFAADHLNAIGGQACGFCFFSERFEAIDFTLLATGAP